MERLDFNTGKMTSEPYYAVDLLKGGAVLYVDNLRVIYEESPFHVIFEVTLIVFILYVVLFKRSYDPKKRGFGDRAPEGLSKREKEELIAEWEPQPLLPAVAEHDRAYEGEERVVKSSDGLRMELQCGDGETRTVTNFSSFDFLGLSADAVVRKAASDTMEKYTFGSCGPRGFYGTFDKHLELEDEIAKFFNVPESITYSDLNSTVSSTIPAFVKRGDLLIIDEHANDAVFTGAQLSRARVRTFRHNDMVDLERVLTAVDDEDRKYRRVSTEQRRFIIVEGLYRNTGHIAPLSAVSALKERFCYRLLVDESSSFGALGETGRGALEHAGLTMADVDVVVGPLNTTLGAVGGFCVGSREIVDHQRLSGAGYCFSASAPPFTAAVAYTALVRMQEQPELLARLHSNASLLRRLLRGVPGLRVRNDSEACATAPLLHVALSGPMALDNEVESSRRLQRIADEAVKEGVAVVTSKYIATAGRPALPEPSLRLAVTAAHSKKDLEGLRTALRNAVAAVAAASGISLDAAQPESETESTVDDSAPSQPQGPAKAAKRRSRRLSSKR